MCVTTFGPLVVLRAVCVQFMVWEGHTSRRHQIFLGGSSDENEKVLGKFFALPPARKKRGSQIFRLWRPFFRCGGTENRKKTVNFSNFFPKTAKFLQKGTPKIFRLRRAFFQKSPRSILRKSSVKVGGSKTYFTPPMTGYAHCTQDTRTWPPPSS